MRARLAFVGTLVVVLAVAAASASAAGGPRVFSVLEVDESAASPSFSTDNQTFLDLFA